MAQTPDGGVVIADFNNHRLRRVGPDGTISTIAGDGSVGGRGDGGPATAAQVGFPTSLATRPDGTLLFTDGDRVRQIGPDGVVDTLAGGGDGGGDGIAALEADLDGPVGLAVEADGSLLVAEQRTGAVRRIAPDGALSTLGVDRAAVWAVAALADGGVLTVEPSPHQVRHLAAGLAPGWPAVSVASPADGAVYAFGDPVTAAYACSGGAGGVASCTGSIPGGALVETSVGTHTFRVTAIGEDGRTTTATSRYVVERAPSRLSDTAAPLVGDARATLRGGTADVPLAGRTVRFATKTGATICLAVTDANGHATCRSTFGGGFGGVLDALGGLFGAESHTVTFGGDAEYLPSSSSG